MWRCINIFLKTPNRKGVERIGEQYKKSYKIVTIIRATPITNLEFRYTVLEQHSFLTSCKETFLGCLYNKYRNSEMKERSTNTARKFRYSHEAGKENRG